MIVGPWTLKNRIVTFDRGSIKLVAYPTDRATGLKGNRAHSPRVLV